MSRKPFQPVKATLEKAEETVKKTPVAMVEEAKLGGLKNQSTLRKEAELEAIMIEEETNKKRFINKLKFYGAAVCVAGLLFIATKYFFSIKPDPVYLQELLNQTVQ